MTDGPPGFRLLGLKLEWLSLPLLLVLWQGAAMLAASRFLPSPIQVAGHVVDLALTGPLLADFAKTLARAVVGFAVAMLLGSVLGLCETAAVVGNSDTSRNSVSSDP